MLHVVCVATEPKGYLAFLEASCHRYNKPLTKLKWRMQWTGYMDKIRSMAAHLQTLCESDSVLFLDAYDTLIVRDPDELVGLCPKNKVLIAVENTRGIDHYKSAFRFGRVSGYLVNSGTYYGTVSALNKVFSIMLKMAEKSNADDDQVLFTQMMQRHPDLFVLDTTRTLAAVCGDEQMRQSVTYKAGSGVHFKYNDIDARPFVLHYLYDGDMSLILNALDYDQKTIEHCPRDHYHEKLRAHHIKSMLRSRSIQRWLLLTVLLVLIVLCVVVQSLRQIALNRQWRMGHSLNR